MTVGYTNDSDDQPAVETTTTALTLPTTTSTTPTLPPTTAPPTTSATGRTATTRAPGGSVGGASYANCTEARAAGPTPIYRGQPGYASHLDRDSDGVACE